MMVKIFWTHQLILLFPCNSSRGTQASRSEGGSWQHSWQKNRVHQTLPNFNKIWTNKASGLVLSLIFDTLYHIFKNTLKACEQMGNLFQFTVDTRSTSTLWMNPILGPNGTCLPLLLQTWKMPRHHHFLLTSRWLTVVVLCQVALILRTMYYRMPWRVDQPTMW